jgi:hypothetical protein
VELDCNKDNVFETSASEQRTCFDVIVLKYSRNLRQFWDMENKFAGTPVSEITVIDVNTLDPAFFFNEYVVKVCLMICI